MNNLGPGGLRGSMSERMLHEISQRDCFIRMKKEMFCEYQDDLLDEAFFTFMLRPDEFYTSSEIEKVNEDDDKGIHSDTYSRV